MTVEVNAKAPGSEILIYGKIETGDAAKIDRELKALGNARVIRLHVHSPGGNLVESLAIFNAIKNHSARVIAFVDGVAASAASFILMAADEVRMSANALIMIHNPSGLVEGGAADMRRTGDLLDTMSDTMITAYSTKSGQSRSRVAEMMSAETWLNADEAARLGFADSIEGAVQIAALDLSGFGFKHPPTPKTMEALSVAYWSGRGKHAKDVAAQAHVEATPGAIAAKSGTSQAPDLVVGALDESAIWSRYNGGEKHEGRSNG